MQERADLTTKVSKTFDIAGYVLDREILNRIDLISKQAVSDAEDVNFERLKIVYWATAYDGNMLKFEIVEALITYLDTELVKLKSLSLQYVLPEKSGINIVFQPKGKIELSAYSNALDFQFNLDRINREIRRCDQEYGWWVRTFVFKSFIRRLLVYGISFFSIFLLYNVWFYIYARNVGVNVDPSVIPSGNTYFQTVEEALKSDDPNKKLNVLLIGQFRNFTNVRDILSQQEKYIAFCLIGLAIATVLALVLRAISRLYPPSFFEFGDQKSVLIRLNRKREIWGITIIIGFVVNVIAGLVLALLI